MTGIKHAGLVQLLSGAFLWKAMHPPGPKLQPARLEDHRRDPAPVLSLRSRL